MKNFFNAIGVADMEKVHSAMIAWILDDENDSTLSNNHGQTRSEYTTFPQNERSGLLCKLFGVSPTRAFSTIKTHVEWNDIDIMIETKDANNIKEVWVIENKLKSQEHKSKVDVDEKNRWNILDDEIWQTEKYSFIIKEKYGNLSQHYMLLSLGGDKARCANHKWESRTYEEACGYLCTLLKGNSNYSLIQEYKNSIEQLIKELNNFLHSHAQYKEVFKKKLTKAEKAVFLANNANCKARYILENGLETIFQKQLLAKMIADHLSSIKDVIYDERNGTAMFIVPIDKINDFELNIEFQGGTYKVGLLHKDYIKNDSCEHTDRLYGKNNTGEGDVFKAFSNLANKYKGWKIAKSKNLKSDKAKPRIAIDKNIGSNWYMNPQNAFVTVYDEAKRLAEEIKNNIPNIP